MPASLPHTARPSLRRIAVYVEEPTPGSYEWALCELEGTRWAAVQRATSPAPAYQQAMADGLVALQAMVDDLDIGPRHAALSTNQNGKEVTPPSTDGGRMEDDAPPVTGAAGHFGFGPVA